MTPDPEVLKRGQYFTPPTTEHGHTSRHHFFDWEEYHRPLSRMHHAHLHGWGIASGMAVSLVENRTMVEIGPGVAVDGQGEMIVLSSSGQADTSLTQPGEADQPKPAPFRLSLVGLDGARYLTVEFSERLLFGEGPGGKRELTPWLRLQPTTGPDAYQDNGRSVILAIVTTDEDGTLLVSERNPDLPFGRRLIGTMPATLQLRRTIHAAGSIQETPAARIEPLAAGGLQVTLPSEGDAMLFGRQDGGSFSSLEVRAATLQAVGNAQVRGKLEVQGDANVQGSLQVQGGLQLLGGMQSQGNVALAGNVEVGATRAPANLTVNGSLGLQRGARIEEFSNDGTLAGSRDTAAPTEHAVKEYVDNLLAGAVSAFAMTEPPNGWLECNGMAIGRTQFARLFARIGVSFGAGDGATTFNVPDLRGLFIRGWDHGSGLDQNRAFGGLQWDGYQNHQHYFYGSAATIGGGWHDHVDHNGGFWKTVKLAGGGDSQVRQYVEGAKTWGANHSHAYTPSGSISTAVGGSPAAETRPRNRALMYCIKY
jgi:microcystin-dependent protein